MVSQVAGHRSKREARFPAPESRFDPSLAAHVQELDRSIPTKAPGASKCPTNWVSGVGVG